MEVQNKDDKIGWNKYYEVRYSISCTITCLYTHTINKLGPFYWVTVVHSQLQKKKSIFKWTGRINTLKDKGYAHLHQCNGCYNYHTHNYTLDHSSKENLTKKSITKVIRYVAKETSSEVSHWLHSNVVAPWKGYYCGFKQY